MRDAQKGTRGREDRVCIAASRRGQEGGGYLPGNGRLAAGILQLEAEVRRLNDLRELRQLREENRKLKTLVADLTLDKHILQEVLSKKV